MAILDTVFFFCSGQNGPADGARAFRQAIDAVMQGIKVSDYAEEHEEPDCFG
jgi:ribulose 1,5-bisphosphate carboxylase large subunit-like protein